MELSDLNVENASDLGEVIPTKSSALFYREISKYLILKENLSKVWLNFGNELANTPIEKMNISRPDKVSHKVVPSVMIDTPPSWVAGVDFPLMFSGSKTSKMTESVIAELEKEKEELSKKILKKYPLLDFDTLCNQLSFSDLPSRHIYTNDDYWTIWYNNKTYDLNETQRKFIQIVHKDYLENHNRIINDIEVFETIEKDTDITISEYRIHRIFRKEQGLWKNLILSRNTNNSYYLNLHF